jgi:hypothetical protein
MLLALAGGKGWLEVVKAEGAPRRAPNGPEVAFYFYKSPATPYSPAPAFGTLTVGRKKKIALKSL